MATYAENRRARFDYEILETFEAGISLFGYEVKAIRNGRMNLSGAFAVPKAGREIFLTNASIAAYQATNTPKDYDPARARRLLFHKKEIATLVGKAQTSGLTLIPLAVYSKKAHIKVLIGVAKKKKKGDKREAIRARDMQREANRAM